jgi:hypothetical protein
VYGRISGFAARRWVLALAVALGTVTTMFAAAPAYAAAPADAAGDGVVTFGPGAVSGSGRSLPDITCSISVSDPMVRTDLDGTREVHANAFTRCDALVNEIGQNQNLWLGTARVGFDSSRTYGDWRLRTETWYPCTGGLYFSEATATIFPPPGYFPLVATIHSNSLFVPVAPTDCTPTTGGGGGGGDGDPNCPIACSPKGGSAHQGSMGVDDMIGEPTRR